MSEQNNQSDLHALSTRLLRVIQTTISWLVSNTISAAGVVVVTTASVLWLLSFPAYWHGEAKNPYLGILMFLILPGIFLTGLLLIPAGILIQKYRRRAKGDASPVLPHGVALRRIIIFVSLTTFANIVIGGQFTYRAITYMETDQFCGQSCHTVMGPELAAYKGSSHSRVECVECHIGGGASWFVKSKLSGTYQVIAVMLNTYPRPLPHPVAALRPARDTCEHCHWPERFTGNKLMVHSSYGDDEANTRSMTVASMKVGGHTWNGSVGIHGAHLDPNTKFEYVTTDPTRETIQRVIYTDAKGKVTEYNQTDTKVTTAQLNNSPRRVMDCMDCHNRPTHVFQLPERAVDEAMAQGSISPDLPFIRKEAVVALKKEYADSDKAAIGIAQEIEGFYKTKYPQIYLGQRAIVQNAVTAIQAIQSRNVFPDMKVTWGSYPNHLGHMDSPGCFRCHDGSHTSANGKTISNDCSTCHDLLAVEEKNPKVLEDLSWGNKPVASTGTGR